MSLGGGSNSSSSAPTIPPELLAGWQGLLSRANATAALPYQAYGGETTAGFTPDQTAGFSAVRDAAGAGTGLLSDASATTRAVSGYQPTQVTSGPQGYAGIDSQAVGKVNPQAQGYAGIDGQAVGQVSSANQGHAAIDPNAVGDVAAARQRAASIDPTAIGTVTPANQGHATVDQSQIGDVSSHNLTPGNTASYFDLYDKNATDPVIAGVNRLREMAQNQNQSDATAAGAFGSTGFGSRFGVTAAGTNEAADRSLAEQLAAMQQDKVATATGLAEQDQSRKLAAGTQNQNTQAALATTDAGFKQDAQTNNANRQLTAAEQTQQLISQILGQNAGFTQDASGANATRAQAADTQNQNTTASILGQNAGFKQDALTNNANRSLTADTQNQNTTASILGQNAGFKQDALTQNANRSLTADTQNQNTTASILGQNAGFKQDALTGDATRALSAAQGNQTAGLQGAQLQLGAGAQLAGLGQQKQNMAETGAAGLLGVGASQQALQQAKDDAAKAAFDAKTAYPLQQLNTAAIPFGLQPTVGSTNNSKGKNATAGWG